MKWLTIVVALMVFAALFVARAARAAELPAVGKPAPDFNLPDQNGKHPFSIPTHPPRRLSGFILQGLA